MLWYFLIGYVVVSQVIVVTVMAMAFFAQTCPQIEALKNQEGRSGNMAIAFVFLTSFVMAPITLLFMIYSSSGCRKKINAEIAYWQGLKKSFTEICLDPLHPGNVEEELQQYFDEQSVAPIALGYELLGECWIKDFEPFNSKGRFFLSTDGLSIAEICRTIDTYACEVTSYLEDGTCVVTVNCDHCEVFDRMQPHGYWANCLPGKDMDELIQAHAEFLEKVRREVSQPVREMNPTQWKDYTIYNNQRFGQIHVELGEKDDGPESCVFPVNEIIGTKSQAEDARKPKVVS